VPRAISLQLAGVAAATAADTARCQTPLRERYVTVTGQLPAERGGILRGVLEEPRRLDLPSLEPLDDYVVVEPSDEESETRGGLIIPASSETGCLTGIVTAVGESAGGVEPGDKVLFPKGAGYDVRLAGTAAKVLRRGDLIARVHD
jgi:co-chaperonin GroES (HSP10)